MMRGTRLSLAGYASRTRLCLWHTARWRIVEKLSALYGVEPDFPWGKSQYQNYCVFRHNDTSKWFALMMNINKDKLLKNNDVHLVDVVNLKAETAKVGILTEQAGIYPAYHMNHKCWISVILDNSLTDDDVMSLIDTSFILTGKCRATDLFHA